MSAFIVEEETIDRVVFALCNWCGTAQDRMRKDDPKHRNDLGQKLWDLNHRSVNARYSEDTKPARYEYRGHPPTMIQAYKSLACLLYQSCESGCDKDPLYVALREAESRLAKQIVKSLPQYDAADWK